MACGGWGGGIRIHSTFPDGLYCTNGNFICCFNSTIMTINVPLYLSALVLAWESEQGILPHCQCLCKVKGQPSLF